MMKRLPITKWIRSLLFTNATTQPEFPTFITICFFFVFVIKIHQYLLIKWTWKLAFYYCNCTTKVAKEINHFYSGHTIVTKNSSCFWSHAVMECITSAEMGICQTILGVGNRSIALPPKLGRGATTACRSLAGFSMPKNRTAVLGWLTWRKLEKLEFYGSPRRYAIRRKQPLHWLEWQHGWC